MKFEEIFQEEGLYRSDTFIKGVAFHIKKNDITGNKELFIKTFKDQNDLSPESHPQLVYDELFKKEYTKVYTRQSLFL